MGPPPTLRLADTVRPTEYAAKLTLTPTAEAFSGEITVQLQVASAVSSFWLHAADLAIDEASLTAATSKDRRMARVTVAGELLGLGFDAPLAAGPATLTIRYHGKLPQHESRGAYRQNEGADQYIFTQFEAVDARRAFPCFDEPSFKTPWQLTLDVPASDLAFANTPQLSEAPGSAGRKVITFAKSKPLPSYLVAFAVGPFEVVDAGKAGKGNTPIRIIVPRGKSAEAKYAAEVTGQVLQRLEDYLGIPYPYEKLDHIAVPMKNGAMENPGLVTFGTTTMLSRVGETSLRLRRGYVRIATHELAHQWFGDLVTSAWWDDIWLNEAFATWATSKIVDRWKPEWDGNVAQAQSRSRVMRSDALQSARRIREPITSPHDIANAFDDITYQKGAAVIGMFEAWIGEEFFRGAVQKYLAAHAHGTGTAEDFLSAVAAANDNGPGIAKAFSTFLDQVGVPLLSFKLECGGAGAAPHVSVAQERFRPMGSPIVGKETWQIPVCLKYPGKAGDARACTLLTAQKGDIPLPEAKACPASVVPNVDAWGYYRVLYEGDLLKRILANVSHLTVPERVALIGNVMALGTAGRIEPDEALALVPALNNDANRHVVASTADIAEYIGEHSVPDASQANYRRFLAKMYGARARALGWASKPRESDDVKLLRQSIVPLVADEGGDAALVAEAKKLADRWITDHSVVDVDLSGDLLAVAARTGDEAFFERLSAAAKSSEDRRDRVKLLRTLGAFTDPKLLAKAFAVTLATDIDARESSSILYSASGDRRTRDATWDFVKSHFDDLAKRLPEDQVAGMSFVAEGFCDAAHKGDVEAFFKGRADKYRGAARHVSQVTESISLCATFRASEEPKVVEFLKKY